MLSINEEINNIWTKINELLFKLGHKSHYNAKCSDGMILTLMVLKIFWTIKSDKHFHRLIKTKFSQEFANIPEYSAYLKRTKKLTFLAFKLIEELSFESRDKYFIIDTKPIPLLEITRANNSMLVKMLKQYRIKPGYGYCAARKKRYYGFKLVVLWNKGKIVCYSLVNANASEQECLMELVKRNNLKNLNIFGDKGFILKIEDKNILSESNIIVEAIPRKNMKLIVPELSFKKYKRKGVETCFSILKDDFDIENIKLTSILGFVYAINQRILSYNLKSFIQKNK